MSRGYSLGALRHRNFRLFFAGQLISMVGWWMHQVAQPWLVLVITNSAFYVGLVSALRTLPVTLFSLYGGVVADRFPKRAVVLLTQTAQMLVALSLAAVVLLDVVRLEHVAIAAVLFGLAAAFDIPGRHSFLVEMVGRGDLMNAIALNSSAFSASRVLGPAVGGILIAAVGVGACFLINGLSYIAVILALLAIRLPVPGPDRAPASSIFKITDGLRFVSAEPRIRALVVMLAVASVFGFSFQIVMPVFVRQVLLRGPEAYGWMVAAAGIGALIGGLGLATLGRHISPGRAVIVGAVGFGLSLVALGFVRFLPAVLLLLVLSGLSMIVQTATTNTMLQTIAPDELRGRVASVYTFAFIGLSPFGALLAGTVAERLGPSVFFVGGGSICALSAAVAARLTRDLVATT